MQFNKATATILAMSLAALLTGCEAEQTEKDMLAEAQFCLDKATDSSSATACMSKIEGLTSEKAYALRCAAGFIGAEVTSPENLSNALNAINGNAGAAGMLSALTFPSVSSINSTFSDCNKSGSAGMKLIAAMAKSATTLASIAPMGSCGADLSGCDTAEITQSINDLITGLNANDPDAESTVTTIVTSIQTVYTSTCGSGTSTNDEICGQITSAVSNSGYDIATTDPAQLVAIGKELLQNWKN
ncbi:hypothetical protein [Bdellovibrio sp. HCB-162]|uniref:hypothetical protein n=1 Tax=Bdellovibrio sp. HCB-162 TaxID=3394234 RepID=UPI0039BD1C7E